MIEAFQHVGIGVTDIDRSYDFYKNIIGFSIKLNDHEEEMEQMVPIIGSLCRMRVIMAMNLSGGGAVELVQHTGSEPRLLPRSLRWGDTGYLAMGVKAYRLTELIERLEKKGATFITPVITTEISQGGAWNSIYLRDPDGLTVELLETAELRASGGKPRVGGFSHVVVGVSDMDRSIEFYSSIVGYDVKVLDTEGHPAEMEAVTGGESVRTVTLKRSRRSRSVMPLEGGMIKLVQAGFKGKSIFEGRRWGDVGIMEMALDVIDIDESYSQAVDGGAEPFCKPTRIDMGQGSAGTFAYIKDPDGNIVEMVEVEKLGFLPPRMISPILSAIMKIRAKL